jgi:hypothetical protein
MHKLLTCALLTTLWSCSATSRAPKTTDACRIPRLTVPDVAWHKCGGEVCVSVEDSIELARHFRKVQQTQDALDGCSLVTLE